MCKESVWIVACAALRYNRAGTHARDTTTRPAGARALCVVVGQDLNDMVNMPKYDQRYDYLDVDAIFTNKRLVRNYVDCLINAQRCTPEGKALKRPSIIVALHGRDPINSLHRYNADLDLLYASNDC
ncbi:unnamed protein product [Chrysodeixis includens]|uniref:Uncharacterized protein n=1 Tax=Chrysodeixis includens TaxID=689277 RepID=A0A9N8KWS0_CHRIL|nr:unnamed protein product [Chrysodeixis includens]